MYRLSSVKIKYLSKTVNHVAGEDAVLWLVVASDGSPVTLKVFGYHITTSGFRLLSPQVLLYTIVGSMKLHCHQQSQWHAIDLSLDTGVHLSVYFHPYTNLPTLQLSTHIQSSFWADAFSFHEKINPLLMWICLTWINPTRTYLHHRKNFCCGINGCLTNLIHGFKLW